MTESNSTTSDNHEQFDDLIGSFDVGMLTSKTPAGELRARPMALADHRGKGDLFFITDRQSAKTDEIAAHPDVCVSFQDGSRFVSVSGTARVDDNRALLEELYAPAMKVWFPDGLDDPDMTLLRVTPTHGEFWDMTGLRRFEYLWKAGKAVLQGESAAEKDFSGHAEVKL